MKKFLFVVLVSLFVAACGANNPVDGEKIGMIVRLEKSGVLFKTWEGQLIRGGMNDGSGVMGIQPFHFTIEDQRLVDQVREAMENQTEVLITYETEGIYSAARSDSGGTFLKSLRPYVKPTSAAPR